MVSASFSLQNFHARPLLHPPQATLWADGNSSVALSLINDGR